MKTDIKNYKKIESEEDHNKGCEGCCFDGGKTWCYLVDHNGMNEALLDRDGDCEEGENFIYEEIKG